MLSSTPLLFHSNRLGTFCFCWKTNFKNPQIIRYKSVKRCSNIFASIISLQIKFIFVDNNYSTQIFLTEGKVGDKICFLKMKYSFNCLVYKLPKKTFCLNFVINLVCILILVIYFPSSHLKNHL